MALLVQLALLVRRPLRHRSSLKGAWRSAAEGIPDGDVLVVRGDEVDAFALPGYRGRPGRVVMTSGMVRALKPGEYEVLLAHERTHLSGRHHPLSAPVDLASMVHPAVRGPGKALEFHLERWATCGRLAMVGS
ncbi:M48 family metalloprotease [Streptomyces lavendulae]|uniref:M48 family metalloprotease n=1 Tax=Streptomyces lavendulae TaxID=1914 RepID=UPI0033F6E905